jgi:hypothetical protein
MVVILTRAHLLDELVASSNIEDLAERRGGMKDLLDLRQQGRVIEDEPAGGPWWSRHEGADDPPGAARSEPLCNLSHPGPQRFP